MTAVKTNLAGNIKRKDLLLGCLDLIVSDGLASLSLGNLHKKTAISKSLIRYYYPDLQDTLMDIFELVVSEGQIQTEHTLFDVEDRIDKIYLIVLSAFKLCALKPNYGKFLLLAYHLSSVDKKMQKIHQNSLTVAHNRIENAIKNIDGISEPENLSWAIHNTIVGVMFRMISLDEIKDYKKYVERCNNAINAILKNYLRKSSNI
jgi:AcrR family transcriptional regulator